MAAPSSDPAVRLLTVSIGATVAGAVLALVWGLATGSQTILFDGVFSVIDAMVSALTLSVLRFIRRGQSRRFPFGREALEPLTVVLQSVAVVGVAGYALAGAVLDIAAGGREVDPGSGLVYAAIATGGGILTTCYLRRGQRGTRSDLVRAETIGWMADALLSAGIMVGFGVALVLERLGYDRALPYTDPVLVAVISVAVLGFPLRLIGQGMQEVLGMSAPLVLDERVRACIGRVQERHRFADSVVRVAKVGQQLDIDADLIVGAGTTARTVEALDAIREEVTDCLEGIGYEPWLTISFTADPKWAT